MPHAGISSVLTPLVIVVSHYSDSVFLACLSNYLLTPEVQVGVSSISVLWSARDPEESVLAFKVHSSLIFQSPVPLQ
jgi:hypothetical protein